MLDKYTERFIGWGETLRQRNLQRVINNTRFVVLPWIECKGLASKTLSLAARQLPNDWLNRYYKATNWIHVGATAGRGKKLYNYKFTELIFKMHKN